MVLYAPYRRSVDCFVLRRNRARARPKRRPGRNLPMIRAPLSLVHERKKGMLMEPVQGMELLEGDAILVAGGTGRVGNNLLRTLVGHGSRLVVVSRQRENADRAIAEQIEADDLDRVASFEADLTRLEAGELATAEVVRRFGRIDAVICIAGGGSRFVGIAESDVDDLRAAVCDNLHLAYNLMVPALRAMLKQTPRPGARSRGRLVAVTAGSSLDPQPKFGIMGIAKAGVNVLMLAIARENKGEGIVANAVVLGTVGIEAAEAYLSHEEFAAAATPQEVADVLAFHASDASSGINGSLIHLNARETD